MEQHSRLLREGDGSGRFPGGSIGPVHGGRAYGALPGARAPQQPPPAAPASEASAADPTAAAAEGFGDRLRDGSWPAFKPAGETPKMFAALWPHYYTLTCMAVYSSPIISQWHLARDSSVIYWVGRWGYVPLLIPALIALCHLLHLYHGRPRLLPVIFSSVMPAVLLVAVANVHLSGSNAVAHMLVSKDCQTFETKQGVHRAWAMAAGLYERCVYRTATERGLTFEQGLQHIRLPMCREYALQDPDTWVDLRRTWEYLRSMEEEHRCAGWCWETVPLWSFKDVKDPCCITAGTVLLNKVAPVASRTISYSLIAGILAVFGIMFYGRRLQDKDLEW